MREDLGQGGGLKKAPGGGPSQISMIDLDPDGFQPDMWSEAYVPSCYS